ncbi:MAG: alpha-ketoglutarate-dependent dioxygenase AlkB family protein [bacterium]
MVESFLSVQEAGSLYDNLIGNVAWHQPEISIFGRKVKSPRLSAWYGDPGTVYRYSGTVNQPLPWLDSLRSLKRSLEAYTGSTFNSVLINQYRDGNDAMGWHADDEPELGTEPIIASISLGSARRFLMKHRTNKKQDTIKLDLNHGSLLIMSGATQKNWKHSISRTRAEVEARINLTFRRIIE